MQYQMNRIAHLQRLLAYMFILAVIGIFNTGCGGNGFVFDINDTSFLWPVPKTKADVDALISLDDLAADGKILPDGVFSNLMNTAKTVGVGNSQISFPAGISEQSHCWKVVGIRINPSAFGPDPAVIQQTGVVPGIRLIVQPVTMTGEVVVVHDFTAHLAFNYVTNNAMPFSPDKVAFGAIVSDLTSIKAFLAQAHVFTTNQELNVHPGFAHNVPGFTDKLRALLAKHLKRNRLQIISFMGIPGEFEPWIFFNVEVETNDALTMLGVKGNFATNQVSSQKLSFRGVPQVDPAPVPDPGAPINGFGVSTSLLFRNDIASHLDDPIFPGNSNAVTSKLKLRDVADLIANPQQHHIANTDCISCHTESSLRNRISGLISQDGIEFQYPSGISKVAPSALPNNKWNLRNFGWGFNFNGATSFFSPTVSQRAANEAAESTDFINRNYLAPLNAQPASAGKIGP